MMMRCSDLRLQLRATNSDASQSSNSGCEGGNPWRPKSLVVATMPRPKMSLPDAIDHDAGGERMVGLGEPQGQLLAVSRAEFFGHQIFRIAGFEQSRRQARPHFGFVPAQIPAIQHKDVGDIFGIDMPQNSRYGQIEEAVETNAMGRILFRHFEDRFHDALV